MDVIRPCREPTRFLSPFFFSVSLFLLSHLDFLGQLYNFSTV